MKTDKAFISPPFLSESVYHYFIHLSTFISFLQKIFLYFKYKNTILHFYIQKVKSTIRAIVLLDESSAILILIHPQMPCQQHLQVQDM